MNCHAIPKNKKCETPTRIIFFDSESYVDPELQVLEVQRTLAGETVEKEHDTYLICANFLFKDRKGNYTEEIKDYHVNMSEDFKAEFWRDVDKFAQVKRKVYIFAHNAKYDVQVTGGIEYLVDNGYRVEGFSDSSPYFVVMTKKMCPACSSSNLYLEEKHCECNECGIVFSRAYLLSKKLVILSSTNYYQTSIKKLGETFKLPKGEVDYKNVTLEESIKYCRQDVLILKTAMMEFIKFIKDERLGGFKMTVAGQAFSAFRHRFMDENSIFIHRSKNALITERGAYAGGRNECWRIGKIEETLYYVDVNSMYPYVMREFNYPVKLISFRASATAQQVAEYIRKGYKICALVDLDTKDRTYFKKTDRLIFPAGNFETYLSTPEIKRALKKGEVKKFKNLCVYESRSIFKDYVEYFYNKRLEVKAKGDEVRSYLYKIFLNSLYGKFGQKKNNNWERVGDADPWEVRCETVLRSGGERTTLKVFGGGVFEKVQLPDGEGEAANSFPAIAAHVTAHARMLLWKFIEVAGKDNVYYMDTDSLFVNENGFDALAASGALDDKELGKLKLEHKIYDVEIRGCKDYKFKFEKEREGVKVEVQEDKIKGVNKKSVKIDENKFVSVIWGGMAKYIKEGKLKGYKNSIIIKELKRAYTKGIINADGIVRPFEYSKNTNMVETKLKNRIATMEKLINELKNSLNNCECEEKELIKEQIKNLKNGIKELKNKKEYREGKR